jgi:glycosyltransferase involved in cell wall biosynthesis
MMKWAERRIISNHRTIRGLSIRDCEVMRRMNPNAQIATIPLAIDPSLYDFSSQEPEAPTIGLIGSMNWGPTRMACARLLTVIWPLVKKRMPGLRLLIAGWGAREAFADHLSERDVTILEDVPEVETCFRKLSLLVFPLPLGSGIKVKVLEAMAYGVPVVTTDEGIRGIRRVWGSRCFANDDETPPNLIGAIQIMAVE